MAPIKKTNNNHSSNNPSTDSLVRQASVLATCYVVDSSRPSSVLGLHYCTTKATGAGCPPLVAIDASRGGHRQKLRAMFREGGTVTTAAATTIREECERFFCESLAAAFLYGERNAAVPGSGLTGARDRRRSRRDGNAIRAYVSDTYGANTQDAHGDVMLANTPPDDHADGLEPLTATTSGGIEAIGEITAWLEFWDYAGGTGFRGFVGRPRGQEESTLFLFFTEELVGMELKQALMALIELADSALGCANITMCIDRTIATEEFRPLLKSLQWVGFEPTTMGAWGGGQLQTSSRWFFMSMEV